MACEVRAATVLRSRGQRRTASRLLVLSTLNHAGRHMSASEVVEEARKTSQHISPSTVYRALASLRDAGVITETLMPGGETRYEWSDESPGHHHLVCRECQAIIDLDSSYFEDLALKLADEYGFESDMSHIALHGVCASCLAKAVGGRRRSESRRDVRRRRR